MPRLLSVNVGLPRDVIWNGKTVRTSVWKSPVTGRRIVRKLDIDGDAQADLAGHGGEHRSVFVYQFDSYHWESFLGRNDFTFGQFGENFTIEGLPDNDVCIGHYCPKEHQQHLELAAFYPKIAVAYTQVATIATDDHHTLQEFRASVGAQWPFLSDPGRTVQKDLDIQEYTDPEHNPMIPNTLVLKPGLVIYNIYNGYWFWGRPSVIDLWHDLRVVTSEIRPDWDLSTPGLREAWNAEDLSRFHGWSRRARREDTSIGRNG